MGMGLSIEAIEREWPTEEVPDRCSQCGSLLKITRYQRDPERGIPPDIAERESEQLCPVCGTPACEESEKENKSINNQKLDFFSYFKK